VLDTSLLGVSVPFEAVEPGHPRMEATVRVLRERLTSPQVGGLARYEQDPYRQGNPWILCTLWLGLYRARIGDCQGAAECLDWALKHRTVLDLLPEQVDKVTGEPAWVVPLTWSHAMFVLLALDLAGKGAV
jgi:GH15 family glucan-1,4-alpha-glucosidase